VRFGTTSPGFDFAAFFLLTVGLAKISFAEPVADIPTDRQLPQFLSVLLPLPFDRSI
jgi:hypothetical protein